MKRRRFYYISWALFWTLVPLVCSNSETNQSELFVFPSMQMDTIQEKSDHVPGVEVIYRGQPPPESENTVSSTTSSSREVVSTEAPSTKGKYLTDTICTKKLIDITAEFLKNLQATFYFFYNLSYASMDEGIA